MVREKTLLSYFKIHASAAGSLNFYTFLVVRDEKAGEKNIIKALKKNQYFDRPVLQGNDIANKGANVLI